MSQNGQNKQAGPKGHNAMPSGSTMQSSQLGRSTRSNTPAANLSGNTQEISNSLDARKYLETRELSVPVEGEISAQTLATTLFHIAELKGIPLPAKNAIRSAAYLLKELDVEACINGILSNVEQRNLTDRRELSNLFDCHLAAIRDTLKENLDDTQRIASDALAKTSAGTREPSYRDALMQTHAAAKGSDTDPRLVAREEIKKRQVLMDEDADSSEIRSMDPPTITKRLNEAISKVDETGSKDRLVRSTRKLTNGGVILEMGSTEAAQWIQREEILGKLKSETSLAVSFKKRPHNTIAFFVPLTFNPDSKADIEEVAEMNELEDTAIMKTKWAKPPGRRLPTQRSGHLLISFSNADAANRAILNGLVICNKRVEVQKCKREPLRCLKCHGWNHVAANCNKETDVCGTCGGTDHRTRDCQNAGTQRCVSCSTSGHPSWDRNCPTFLRKCEEQNARLPENNMPFFPTHEPWTWARTPPPPSQQTPVTQAPSFLDQALRPARKNGQRQTQLRFHRQPGTDDRWGMAITSEGEANVWQRDRSTGSRRVTGPNAMPVERGNRTGPAQTQTSDSRQSQENPPPSQ
jgi:hypothetical protein